MGYARATGEPIVAACDYGRASSRSREVNRADNYGREDSHGQRLGWARPARIWGRRSPGALRMGPGADGESS